MRRLVVMLSLLALAGAPAAALAHEGHAHQVMGTVSAVDAKANRIEVKTADGKVVSFTVSEQTKFLRGKAPAALKDVQAGSRIVAKVTTEEDATTASEVMLPEAAPGAAPHEHKH